jgi:hypothetical protein
LIFKEKKIWKFIMRVVPVARKASLGTPTFSTWTFLFTAPIATSISNKSGKREGDLPKGQPLWGSPGSTARLFTCRFKRKKDPHRGKKFSKMHSNFSTFPSPHSGGRNRARRNGVKLLKKGEKANEKSS